ncbi:glycoside hydrolase family 3 protein [Gracilibacillus massiliensis]|uniref:glycoside hydrolase family 3 protein n=1 Tax=Gracilibacillus massiliensis TaxID=1564956 RepID=UPI00071E42F6|nr:glycoside hydrolase family 3 N-terminal domain-containing protein [Gracilibacillus massiliensis]
MKQNEVKTKVKQTITVDGKSFRDLNGNGVLDPYENWELSTEERVEDLLSKMSLEEKAGMMMISSQFMPGSDRIPGGKEATVTDESGLLNTKDVELKYHPFLKPGDDGYEFEQPLLYSAGTKKAIHELHNRYFIVRDNPKAKDLAKWTNKIQEIAESSRLGIPAIMTSNPRNHIGHLYHGMMEASGEFSLWPGELGLAATHDAELVKEFGQIAAKEWRSAGLHKMYGYMADIATDPLWMRYNGTFGEDPNLAAAMTRAVVEGFQGEKLNKNSVALTIKHFPGGGARHQGHDPHYPWGSFNPYPTKGSLYEYHIPPFKAAIDAGTSSIMPYYAFPSNQHSAEQLPNGEQFEEYGFAYNKRIVKDILRDELGFNGYINSDTGIVNMMPWGVEHLSKVERYAKALKAGVNMFSDEADPSSLIQSVKGGYVSESLLDQSVRYLLSEMMELGLFDNPYVDEQEAQEIADSANSQLKADYAHQKSLVLLRNDNQSLPLPANIKLYIEVVKHDQQDEERNKVIKAFGQQAENVNIVENIEEADYALVVVVPTGIADRPDTPLTIKVDHETGVDVDRIKAIEKQKPTILAVNMMNPWAIGEIEQDAVATFATFGVKYEALAATLTGQSKPSGKLPFTIPKSQEIVEQTPGDIPGHKKGEHYVYTDKHHNRYLFGFGLSY